jgi:hypothetical protein
MFWHTRPIIKIPLRTFVGYTFCQCCGSASFYADQDPSLEQGQVTIFKCTNYNSGKTFECKNLHIFCSFSPTITSLTHSILMRQSYKGALEVAIITCIDNLVFPIKKPSWKQLQNELEKIVLYLCRNVYVHEGFLLLLLALNNAE